MINIEEYKNWIKVDKLLQNMGRQNSKQEKAKLTRLSVKIPEKSRKSFKTKESRKKSKDRENTLGGEERLKIKKKSLIKSTSNFNTHELREHSTKK